MKFPIDISMKTTALVTTIGIITLGIYDLVVVSIGQGESLSVSRFLINVTYLSPMFVFAVGVVCGHIFCSVKTFKSYGDK
jgi:hypothetical protein